MRMPARSADAALVATHDAVRERVRGFSEAQGWTLTEVAGEEDYNEALQKLREEAVMVEASGETSTVKLEETAARRYGASDWAKETPASHLTEFTPRRKRGEGGLQGGKAGQKMHSRVLRVLESLDAVEILEEQGRGQHWRETMLSSGGQGTGKFWTTIPQGRTEFYGVDHFITALRLRMADINIPIGAVCQMGTNKGEAKEDRCSELLDPKGEHLLKCKKGRGRYGPHRAM